MVNLWISKIVVFSSFRCPGLTKSDFVWSVVDKSHRKMDFVFPLLCCSVVVVPTLVLWLFVANFVPKFRSRIKPDRRPEESNKPLENDNDSCFLPNEESLATDIDKFRKDLLIGHNHFRRLHGSPPLTLSDKLNEAAQRWAEEIARRGYLQYADGLPNTGESIAKFDLSANNLNGKVVSAFWYKEIKNYSFTEPRWRRGAFHFTQMIWQSTTMVGAGLCAVPGTSRVFAVVRYFPTGNSNSPGEFHRNVTPRISVPSEAGSRTSWNSEDDVILRSSVSGKLGCRRSCVVSSSVMDEAFV